MGRNSIQIKGEFASCRPMLSKFGTVLSPKPILLLVICLHSIFIGD